MGFSFGNLLKPVENLFHPSAQAHPTPTPGPAPTQDGHAGATSPASQSAAQAAAAGLGAHQSGGPALNATWNHIMGGPGGGPSNDGRDLSVNHIGNRLGGGPMGEGGTISNLMRNTPYLGDYWEALSVTHDSKHVNPPILNGLTAISNVGLAGPAMAAVDAIPRLFGHSLFLNNDDK